MITWKHLVQFIGQKSCLKKNLRGLQQPPFGGRGLIPHLHICSDLLITKKSNIQSSVWTTLMKLGMWVVMSTRTTHVVCFHQTAKSQFNSSFAYLF